MGNRQHLPLHQSNISPVSLNTSSNLHQEPLIASVSSPSPEAGILSTPTLTSDVHIMSETISLTSNSVSNIYYISGCLSCTTECILNIYYFTAEEVTHEGVTTRYIYNESKPSEPISVRYSAGMNQQISPELISVDSDKYSAEELCLSEGRTYPVILEIKPVVPSNGVQHSEISYLTFVQQREGYGVKVVRQKLNYEDKCYNLYDIYCIPRGATEEEDSPDCIICMTNRKDTSLLPCAHMCVCAFCANILRSQPNPKCPICRSAVATLLQIKVNDN